jgi:hypothetical protein
MFIHVVDEKKRPSCYRHCRIPIISENIREKSATSNDMLENK